MENTSQISKMRPDTPGRPSRTPLGIKSPSITARTTAPIEDMPRRAASESMAHPAGTSSKIGLFPTTSEISPSMSRRANLSSRIPSPVLGIIGTKQPDATSETMPSFVSPRRLRASRDQQLAATRSATREQSAAW
ncbi:hypothetical protein [Methylobacterium sp.]|uniref:hypothetical protein n=1 Tax=Methylobacterium sp. TaxID=409 RepID=UPI0025E1C6EE|nr:hypothetical protein [Methylobacterium sp.]